MTARLQEILESKAACRRQLARAIRAARFAGNPTAKKP
jgi:hypothetical protein